MGLAASIWKGSHWLFGYVPRIKWHPKSVSQRKGLLTCSCQLSYKWRKFIRGKRGISLIVEAMEQLQVYSFLQSPDGELFSELFDKIDELAFMMRDPSKNQVNITSQWRNAWTYLKNLKKHSIHSRQVILQRVTCWHTRTIS